MSVREFGLRPRSSFLGIFVSNFRYSVFAVGPLRTMLDEQEPGNIRCLLAARADKLWAPHKEQSHDLVANVEMTKEQSAQQI